MNSEDDKQQITILAKHIWEICGKPLDRDASIWLGAESIFNDNKDKLESEMKYDTALVRESISRYTEQFFSSFVGTQGEFFVDSANKRVHMHDGITPGGWQVANHCDLSGRNSVINGTFVVNQRAYKQGTHLAANAYGHDLWKAGPAGCSYEFVSNGPDTTLAVTVGTILQVVGASSVYAPSMWLTWRGSSEARAWQGTLCSSFSAGTTYLDPIDGLKNKILLDNLIVGAAINLEFACGTLGLVQLEATTRGASPTRFERRQNEISLCLPYYTRLGAGCLAKVADADCIDVIYATSSLKMPYSITLGITDIQFYSANGNPAMSANSNIIYIDPALHAIRINGFSSLIRETVGFTVLDFICLSAEP